MGPVDGHDITRLIYMLRRAKEMQCPVLLHVLTQKGKGYEPAEKNPDIFHGVGRFDPATGELKGGGKPTFSEAFGESICELASKDEKLCAITAAMSHGTCLDTFAKAYPERFFDVGIAEGHAVSMAGGLAKQGMTPVVAIYSTFLQRAYDMLMQDVALLKLHVVFAVDRAGLVGPDGETHHGVFDVGYLRQIPGMTVLCPANRKELKKMLFKAIYSCSGPVAVRYPRGGDGKYSEASEKYILREGNDLTLVTYGIMVNEALDAADLLAKKGIRTEIVKLDTICPLPMEPIVKSVKKTGNLFVAEDCANQGCVAREIFSGVAAQGILAHCDCRNFGNRFIPHGSTSQLFRDSGLDGESLSKWIMEAMSHG